MFGKVFTVALSLAVLPLTAASAPIAYKCDFTDHSQRLGWIPEEAFYVVDEAAETALAYDKFIHYTNKAPKATEFKIMKSQKYFMKWTLSGLPARGNRTLLGTYTTRLDVNQSKATISATMHGWDGDIRGSGTCKRIK